MPAVCAETTLHYTLYSDRPDRLATDDGHLNWICDQLRRRLGELNQTKFQEVQSHLRAAIDCVVSGVRYRFVQLNGELLGAVTDETPMVTTCVFALLMLPCASQCSFVLLCALRYRSRMLDRLDFTTGTSRSRKASATWREWRL